MTTQEVFDQLTDNAIEMCEASNWETSVTQIQLVIASVLGDVPLLMQAIGAEREDKYNDWPSTKYPGGFIERWNTPWVEVQP